MGELLNRLNDEELEQEAKSYRRYLEILQLVQGRENDLCPDLSTRCVYSCGKFQIHSCAPSASHFLGSLNYDRRTVYFANDPANSASNVGIIEQRSSCMISVVPDVALDRQVQDLLYFLPDELLEAYQIAVSLLAAQLGVDAAIEQHNNRS